MTTARSIIGPIVKMPVEVQATNALRDSIVSGRLEPGSRVTEISLATQMNLSRATVRTALHKLAKEGLITLIPYTGWLVVALSSRDAWELYTLRSAIERLAGRLVASRLASGKDVVAAAQLKSVYNRLVEACKQSGSNAIAEADFDFHKTIIELADHARLARQFELIEQQIRMYIRSSDALVEHAEQIIGQHSPIVEAILLGDVEEAGKRSEVHNLVEGEKLSAYLAESEAKERSGAGPSTRNGQFTSGG